MVADCVCNFGIACPFEGPISNGYVIVLTRNVKFITQVAGCQHCWFDCGKYGLPQCHFGAKNWW